MFDPVYASAGEIAQAIREGRISAVETLDAHLERVARLNEPIHAIVTLDEEGARQRARQADSALARGEIWGPLHGVPITICDHIETAGMRTTEGGNPKWADHIPERDAVVVARLRNAGAIIFGKTNDDHNFWGEKALFPLPNNPWDTNRKIAGAGGPMAAVAAGFTPIELAPDAGSVQAPSAYCGIYALRPTEHRIPFGDIFFAEPLHAYRNYMNLGLMARTIGDLRLALEILAGPNSCDTDVAPVPLGDYEAPALSELRIAWSPTFPEMPIDIEIAQGIHAFAANLESAGVQTTRSIPEIDYKEIQQIDEELWIMPIRALNELRDGNPGPSLSAYLKVLQRRDKMIGEWERFLNMYDAVLLPVAARTAPLRNEMLRVINGVELSPEEAAFSRIPHMIAPTTGLPTVVLPLGRTREGMPYGVQLLGHRWKEMRLLAIAERVATLTEGFVRPPGY